MLWQISAIIINGGHDHYDGTDHRQIAVLGVAGDHGDNLGD